MTQRIILIFIKKNLKGEYYNEDRKNNIKRIKEIY